MMMTLALYLTRRPSARNWQTGSWTSATQCSLDTTSKPTGSAWLAEAYWKITSEWMSVEFAKDYPQPDVWQPIPVERNNPSVERAEAALDKGIDIIRSDNGYNATHPEERRYVLDHLTAFAKRMKEDAQIGWMYFKTFALEPLDTVIKRFGKAATGIAAAAAREALIRWARESGGEIIRFLLSLLT